MEEVSPQDAQEQNMDLMELQNGTRPRGAVSSTRKKPSTKMKRGSEQGSRKGEYEDIVEIPQDADSQA